jgi:uncharacterized membrane protein YvbJ
MAIINCPECNNSVSEKADTCPNCALPINRKSSIVKAPENKEGCFLQTLNIGCLLIFILIASIVIIVIIGGLNS